MHPADPRFHESRGLWGAVVHGGGDAPEQETGPWEGAQPYLKKGYEAVEENILDRPQEFYPGQTWIGFSPETEQALGLQAERARQGSGLQMAGQAALGNLVSTPTEQNPYFQQVGRDVMSQVLPQVQAAFGGAGRAGDSPLAQQAAATGATRALAPYAYGGYESGEQRRLQGMGMTPGMAQADYADFARLGQVGQAREANALQQLQDQMARWQFEQEEPASRSQRFLQLIGGTAPTAGVSTGGSGPSPIFGLLGAGLTAAGTGGWF